MAVGDSQAEVRAYFAESATAARLEAVARALEANGFGTQVEGTAHEVKQTVLDLVPLGSEVHTGSSATLETLGLLQEFESGRYDSMRASNEESTWTRTHYNMSDRIATPAAVNGGSGVLTTMPPRWVFSCFNPVARFLLAAGIPLGLNGLITVRGRKSGQPRTTPVAIIEASGRRWVWCPWGDVQWVRNLRVARRATISARRREEEVAATELDPTQRVGFFRDVLVLSRPGCPLACGSFASSMELISVIQSQRPTVGVCSSSTAAMNSTTTRGSVGSRV
jgi:deazaflavin-dependent oxidoreductase (nitroreductase family)